MSADPVRRIADAVLYEGYVLWPYRRSALKNQQRFTFGGVYPLQWPEGPPEMVTECLLETSGAPRVRVDVRFLQVVERQVRDARELPVDELVVDGERHLSWDEATERELTVPQAPARLPIDVPAGSEEEPLIAANGDRAGALVRSWRGLRGEIEVSCDQLGPDLHRVRLVVRNAARWAGAARDEVLRETFCSTHAVLQASGGRFASLTDPPGHLVEAAAACRNDGAWPVLVGAPGERDTVLASPIILEDYPRVAPESPGDLFDGGEIDQLLTLNILALTESEKAEMRASDPRAREILERTESLSQEELMRLHGTIRDLHRLER